MAASSTDKFTKSYSFLQKSLGATISNSDTSLTLNNYTNIPTDTKVHFIIDRIDSNGNRTNSTRELVSGICTGSAITNLSRGLHGTTAQSHSGGAVVEFVLSGAAWNDLIDGILVSLDQDGTLKAGAVDGSAVLADNVVTNAKLADNAVNTAEITDDAVTAAKMQYGMVRNRQGGASGDASWATAGTTTVATDSKAAFIQAGSITLGSTDQTITFPTAYNQVPLVFVTCITNGSFNTYGIVNTITSSNFKLRASDGSSLRTGETYAWIAIGQ